MNLSDDQKVRSQIREVVAKNLVVEIDDIFEGEETASLFEVQLAVERMLDLGINSLGMFKTPEEQEEKEEKAKPTKKKVVKHSEETKRLAYDKFLEGNDLKDIPDIIYKETGNFVSYSSVCKWVKDFQDAEELEEDPEEDGLNSEDGKEVTVAEAMKEANPNILGNMVSGIGEQLGSGRNKEIIEEAIQEEVEKVEEQEKTRNNPSDLLLKPHTPPSKSISEQVEDERRKKDEKKDDDFDEMINEVVGENPTEKDSTENSQPPEDAKPPEEDAKKDSQPNTDNMSFQPTTNKPPVEKVLPDPKAKKSNGDDDVPF